MFENFLDEELLKGCKAAVQLEKQSTAKVLEYLVEIDKRRLWVKEGYSSLYDFCIRYLNYSEGETHRRIQACRLTSRVEEVKPLLEQGTLSLTAASLLAPHLDNHNAKEILPQVMSQPTRTVEKIIRKNFPESCKKKEVMKVELDEELSALLDEAKRIAGEKDAASLLKKVLKSYVRERKTRASAPRRHTRYVPIPLAREVRQRDEFQCTYVGPNGIRCNQKAHLEIDHIRPWAKGGSSHDIDNLRCLCRTHNLFVAKGDFPAFWTKNFGQPVSRR